MMTWIELSDRYFQWWQSSVTRYLDMFKQEPFFLRGLGLSLERSLEFKKFADQMMDEMWYNFRLPSREDVTRLGERINLLESRLVQLQERDWAEEVVTGIVKEGKVPSRDDLKPLRKTLNKIEKGMAGASELDTVKETVAQVEAKVGNLAEELARIKEAVAQVDPKLGALEAVCEKLAKEAPAGTPAAAE